VATLTTIFTAAIAMLWQWEPWNRYRVLGVAISFLGSALMVLLSKWMAKNHQQQQQQQQQQPKELEERM
jgi:drug/metabolite transporter (DMT)-like permease